MMKWILMGIVVLAVLLLIVSYNGLIRLKNSVEEALATMDVYLKKRFDLIPNLVATVKGCSAYESKTIKNVVQARNIVQNCAGSEEKIKSEGALSGSLRSLFALSESYPELKANAGYLELQGQLQTIEEDIANARKYYNAVVKEFNNKVEIFPSNLVAKAFHFEKKTMFEVNDKAERENVNVEF